jgi:hypothetical protein
VDRGVDVDEEAPAEEREAQEHERQRIPDFDQPPNGSANSILIFR